MRGEVMTDKTELARRGVTVKPPKRKRRPPKTPRPPR